ncbi:MAG: hypothetical protein JWP03_3681 [Phycisphaerales bacterium]|jgi:hypothetical protein|nr:hypothetical protein [Phycisphaerales bacterium]
MPSPFPGMDPYLEEPGLWPDVHHELISSARHILTEQLRPRYSVRIEDRVYISDERDPGRRVIIPDLRIVQRPGPRRPPEPASPRATAVAEPLQATTLIQDEIRESRVEIIDRSQRVVVTVIEILSPANKIMGSRGRDSYEQKRNEVMYSPSHFVEIDLLRSGEGFPPQEALPAHDYTVHVSRVQHRPHGTVWPIRLEEHLPTIKIPLRGDDPETELDLQAVLDAAYDGAAYDLEIDYRAQPVPTLSEGQAQWADALLREKRQR